MNAEYLRAILDYDPETGQFRWKQRFDVGNAWNARMAGKVAGWVHGDGYVGIGINGAIYQAHRLAWLWMTGKWPDDQVDHRDGNRSNNRFYNLRPATQAENCRNTRRPRNNTSGYKGVCFIKRTQRWRAQIRINRKRIYLGEFDAPEIAYQVYSRAACELHGDFARVS